MTRTERQELAIERWKQAGARNTIVAATGVGKTRIALMVFAKTLAKHPNTVIRVVVPTKVLKDQWEERIEEYQLDGDIKVIVMNTAAKKPFYCDLLTLDKFVLCPG